MKYLSDAEIEQLEQSSSSKKYLSDAEMDALEGQSTVVKQPTKTSKWEDVGIGLTGLGHMGKDALDLLAGAAATHLGGDSDSIYANMEARNKAWEAEMKSKDQGLGGQIISGLTQIAPAVAAIPITGPLAAMGAFAGTSAMSQGGRNVGKGADAWTEAVPQAVAEGALDMTAAKLIPGGKGILQGMGYGAAGNLASQVGQDITAHGLLPEAALEPYKPDANKYIVSGVTGALPGAAIGHFGKSVPDTTPNVIPDVSNVQQMRDQIVFSTRALEATKLELQQLEKSLDNAKTDEQVKRILDQIFEKESDVFKLESTIKNLSEHPEIRAEQPTNVPPDTNLVKKEPAGATPNKPDKQTMPMASMNQEVRLRDGTIVKVNPVGAEYFDGLGNLIDRNIVLEWRNAGETDWNPPYWTGEWTIGPDGRSYVRKQQQSTSTQPSNVPPETVVDTLPINREPSVFRSAEEAFDAATQNKAENLSQIDALLKTEKETKEILAERQALIEKQNKTLEDDLRIAKLSDMYDEIATRNNPRDELLDTIQKLREEIADLKEHPEDVGVEYANRRIVDAENQLKKYLEFQRRAESSVRNEPAKRSSAEIKAEWDQAKAEAAKATQEGRYGDAKMAYHKASELLKEFFAAKKAEKLAAETPEPEPVKQFVPGVTPTEVHSNYIKQIRDYVTTGKFSDEGIQESIDARNERMEIIKHLQDIAFKLASPEGDAKAERYENTLELMRLENANLQAIKDLPHNERQAAFKVLLQHLEGVDYTKLAPEQVTEVMRGIVEHGTLRQGLKTLAENSTSPLIRTVAGFLHSNPKIGRFVKLHYDSKLEHPASAAQRDKVEISFRDPSDVKSTHFVHEALHAATSGMMLAWKAGYKFPEPVTKALQNIQDLHTDLKGKLNLNFVNAIYTELYLNAKESGQPINHEKLAADAKLHADEALKNERELLAYGNSHQTIADALSRVEVATNKSAAKRLYESVATALGFGNKETTTALQKLMDNSQTLIEHSEGMSFKQITGRDTTAEDYTREYRTVTGDIGFKSSNKFLQGLADIGAGFGRRVFITPSNLKNYYNHPFIHKVAEVAERAQREATMIFNEVMTGDPTFSQFKSHLKGKLFSMSKALDERGLEYAINNTPVKAIGQVARLMDVVIRDGISWEQALQQKLPGATPAQVNFARSMDRAANILLTRANEMLTARGLQPIREASGYVIRNLVGRYYTDKTYNGEVFERRYFASEAEAKAYAKTVMQSDPLVNASVSKRNPKANFEDITRVLDDIIAQAREGVDPAQYAAAKRETIKSQASSVGGHKIHRGLVHNFMGGLTDDASLGKAFADSLSQGVGEYTNSIRLRQIAADTAQDMHGQSSEVTKARYPNAFKVAQYFLDNEMNRLDHNKFTESIAPFTDFVNETVNNITFNTFGKRLSSDVIAKSWQDLTRVAYNLKLTSAPVTWLAQSMATLQASRGVFKEGAGFIDGMGAMSKGILRTLFKQYDDDAIKGLYHVSQNLDTFHKHTINDSTIGQMSKKTTFDEFRKWVLGEKFTEGSDSFSRIAAYNISYEALKSMGWRAGDVATYEKAAEMATENMIAMGKKSLPGIYKELGFLGTSQAPLRGYMHGAFANLAVDVKDVILNHDKASALALTANMMSIMLLGGVLGAPFLADYEYLRQLLTKSGAIAYDALPHWTKLAESLPNWASHGVISDLTGVDMGASMRYNSIFKPFGDVAEATNLANLSLQLGTATDLVGSTFGVAKDVLGNQPHEAARVNWNKLLPRGPAKAIKEELYDYRGASVAGTRGDKLVDRGPTERVATLLGSSSIKEAKTRTAREEDRVKTEQINLRKQKAVDLILSPNQADKLAGRQLVQKMVQAKDITGEEAASLVMGRMVKRNRPVLENMMSTKPEGVPSTLPQARKARDLLPYLQE